MILAGGRDRATATLPHCLGGRNTHAWCRDVRSVREARYPVERYTRLAGVVDHDTIQTAKAVEPWVATHPRVTLRFVPTYCPRANPIARAFGDGHDCGTRHHQRKRVPDRVAAGEHHLPLHGPWPYKRSQLYDAPAVTAAIEQSAAQEQAPVAASLYQSSVDRFSPGRRIVGR